MEKYRCVAVSVEGFVQQLACNLVNHGYWHYVVGRVPEEKQPTAVDEKLMSGYDIVLSKWQRARHKKSGRAKIAYLRHGRFFVLIATEGEHVFKRREKTLDIRRRPILFAGYSIGCGKGSDGRYHASVKIERETFNNLLAHLRDLAVRRSVGNLVREFGSIRFQPYARVRRQLLRLLREVNDLRRTAGLESLPRSCLRLRRQLFLVFDNDASAARVMVDISGMTDTSGMTERHDDGGDTMTPESR